MVKAIYKITHQINGKSYIGQSVKPQHRFIAHKSRARNGDLSSARALYRAIQKYGEGSFTLEILEWTENYNERERELIEELGTMPPDGYNIAPGGEEPPHRYGKDHHKSVITEEQIDRVIEELKAGKLTEPEIGRLFKPPFNQPLIHNINFGITHRRESESYPIRTLCPYNLSRDEVEDVMWLLQSTKVPMADIAAHFQVSSATIKHINAGRNRFNHNVHYPIRKTRGKRQPQPVETILANRSTPTIDTWVETGICEQSYKR